MLEVLNEKELFLLTTIPPLLLTAYVLRLLSGNPQPLLESVSPMVPGLVSAQSFGNGCMCFRLEAKPDIFEHVMHENAQFTSSLLQRARSSLSSPFSAGMNNAGSPNVSGLSPEHSFTDDLEQGDSPKQNLPGPISKQLQQQLGVEAKAVDESMLSKEREIWINLRHLVRASSVPILFLMLYLWDSAFIHRRASYDFPLLHCMDPDASHCFYMEQDYSVFRWPHYLPLGCHRMRDETVEDVKEYKFFFSPPPNAQFYKCYSTVFSFNELVGALGDVMALTALCALVIIRASIQVNTLDANELEELQEERKSTRWHVVGAAACFVASLFTVSHIYGKWSNDLVFYLCFPGLCIFSIFLLNNRLELLDERIRKLEDDQDAASRSTSSSAEDDDLSYSSQTAADRCCAWLCNRLSGGSSSRSRPRMQPARRKVLADTGDRRSEAAFQRLPTSGRREKEQLATSVRPRVADRSEESMPTQAADGPEAASAAAYLRAPRLPIPQITARDMAYTALCEMGSTSVRSPACSSASPGGSGVSKVH